MPGYPGTSCGLSILEKARTVSCFSVVLSECAQEGGCDIAAELENATAAGEKKLIRDCLRECAESYQLSWEHDAPWETVAWLIANLYIYIYVLTYANMSSYSKPEAKATPSLKSCSQDVADKLCHPINMQCASAFGEFPNACGGSTLNPSGKIWIAFYAYRREFLDSFRDVLETRAIFGEGATCGWRYKIGEGAALSYQLFLYILYI